MNFKKVLATGLVLGIILMGIIAPGPTTEAASVSVKSFGTQ